MEMKHCVKDRYQATACLTFQFRVSVVRDPYLQIIDQVLVFSARPYPHVYIYRSRFNSGRDPSDSTWHPRELRLPRDALSQTYGEQLDVLGRYEDTMTHTRAACCVERWPFEWLYTRECAH